MATKNLKNFIKEELTKLYKLDLLKEEKIKIEKELNLFNETKDVYAMYKKAGMEAPHPGKGIHTKKFHKCVTDVGDDKGKNPYAICMSSLGKDKAVKADHRTDENAETQNNSLVNYKEWNPDIPYKILSNLEKFGSSCYRPTDNRTCSSYYKLQDGYIVGGSSNYSLLPPVYGGVIKKGDRLFNRNGLDVTDKYKEEAEQYALLSDNLKNFFGINIDKSIGIKNEDYSERNPKIDLFYKDSKGTTHYMSSTNWSKGLKQAIEGMKNSLEKYPQTKRAYQNKFGEEINVDNISAGYDKNINESYKEKTEQQYIEYLNQLQPDFESDEWIIGGKNRAQQYYNKYGLATKKFDPIGFNVGYNEWKREN